MNYREKQVYNIYLEVTRRLNDKPFRPRKDFGKFEESEDYVYVSRLARFFDRFENIPMKDFFEAPFFVYDEKYFDLHFYTTPKALKSYTAFHNTFILNNPDNPTVLEKTRDSFNFIFRFCKDNNVKFTDYIKYIHGGSTIPSYLSHLKDRKICLYSLFVFPDFEKSIANYDQDIKEFMFGDILDKLRFYRTNFLTSDKNKKLCHLIFNKLNLL